MDLVLVLDEAGIVLALTVLFEALKATPVLAPEGRRAYIPLASLILGVAIYVVWYAWSGVTEPSGYLAAVITGVIVGGAAVGIHEMRATPERIRSA